MPVGIRIRIKGVEYQCIKEKEEGKNTSEYDGTYAPVAMMEALRLEAKDPNKTQNYPTGLVFVKKCPEKPMLVEGFVEALAGEIISQLISKGFIEADRESCFSPATLNELPDGSLALVQPFAQGYKPIYTLNAPGQTAKSVTKELVSKHVYDARYDYITRGHVEQHGLSYAIMVMITLLGNYSLHSGNVFVKKIAKTYASETSTLGSTIKSAAEARQDLTSKVRPISDASTESLSDEWTELHYKIIDYGASYRHMHLTEESHNIFTSLEEASRTISTGLSS